MDRRFGFLPFCSASSGKKGKKGKAAVNRRTPKRPSHFPFSTELFRVQVAGKCTMQQPDEPTPISDRELDEIMARCEQASQGPWRSFLEGRDHLGGADFIMTGEAEQRGPDIELLGATRADQEFIAHARQDVPRLVAEIRRLKRALREAN